MNLVQGLWVVLLLAPPACQRASGVGDDSDTEDTATATESADTAISSDSNSGSDSSGADSDTQTDTDSDSDTEPLPEPVENEWIFIEGGSFEMGYDGPDQTTRPVHTVNVPSFEIQKTEVTAHQYRQCVDAGVCSAPVVESEGVNRCEPLWHENNWLEPMRLNYPINCINYFQAGEYCNWIGGRLPSEAEWEYAASGGGQDIMYPWGDEYPTCDLVAGWGGLDDYQDCWSFEQPVCSKPTGNSYHGLCDMAANYDEWVADRVEAYYGYVSSPTDGSAQIDEDIDYAIVRGGNCEQAGSSYSVHARDAQDIDSKETVHETVRCVRDVE
ncbi:MAG: SUMF1/EgtB/PvdO family nonheme iron enzyme [Deltaproteobacteria bacterium]|nr:SUMF1/EgtB/PvdO family nonheme iron enzyme [Deltaproteobacteria bacterium]